MPPKPTGARNDVDALRAALADADGAPNILIWTRSKPRIATMRPVARALMRAGFRTFVGYSTTLEIDPEEFASDLSCFELPDDSVPGLEGVTVFISAEHNVGAGPPGAIRFAIHHSLPDDTLRRDYGDLLGDKPIAAAVTDYYAIPVRQEPSNWSVDRYAPHVDGILPRSLLVGRKKTLSIVPFGYPKLDQMIAEDLGSIARDTITYAPTQSTLTFSTVATHGHEILQTLLDRFPDHRIAFRPYPGADHERLSGLIAGFADHPRFVLDDSATGEDLMRRTAVVVTDRSSIAMSFGLGYCRPVVFFQAKGLPKGGSAQIVPFRPLGLRAGSPEAMANAVDRCLRESDRFAAEIAERRGEFIYNIGRTGEYLAEILPDIIAGRDRPEFLDVPRAPFAGQDEEAIEAHLAMFRKKLPPPAMRRGGLFDRLAAAFRDPSEPEEEMGVTDRIARKMQGLRRYLSPPTDRGPQ